MNVYLKFGFAFSRLSNFKTNFAIHPSSPIFYLPVFYLVMGLISPSLWSLAF